MEHDSHEKIPGKSVVDQVANGIISRIIDGSLHPGDKPEASFALSQGDEAQAVYAYCNLHGLWKA